MNLDKVIEIASFIYNSQEVPKEGLKIIYNLPLEQHKALDKELFQRTNNASEYIHNNTIDVNIGGIMFTFEVDRKQ
jgi:hypothetical protein